MCNYTAKGRWESGVESEVKGREGRDEHAKKKVSHKGKEEDGRAAKANGERERREQQRGRNGGQ